MGRLLVVGVIGIVLAIVYSYILPAWLFKRGWRDYERD